MNALEYTETSVDLIVRHPVCPGSDEIARRCRQELKQKLEAGIVPPEVYLRLDHRLATSKHLS